MPQSTRTLFRCNQREIRRGTSVVEAAFVLPILFFFVLAIIELGHAQMVANLMQSACRSGAYAVKEWSHFDGEVDINISDDPITTDYATIDTIQRRHQAGDYDGWTGMGDGVLKAHELLIGSPSDPQDDGHVRYGARPTMLIMTDGQTNQGPSGWSLPASFDWDDWTDYDGDGNADYSTNDWKKQYAFWEATEAAKRGIKLHTMAVGAGADRNLMEAIAYAGQGVYINVPGGTTVAEMEDDLMSAFRQIAAKVPPPKLVFESTAE